MAKQSSSHGGAFVFGGLDPRSKRVERFLILSQALTGRVDRGARCLRRGAARKIPTRDEALDIQRFRHERFADRELAPAAVNHMGGELVDPCTV